MEWWLTWRILIQPFSQDNQPWLYHVVWIISHVWEVGVAALRETGASEHGLVQTSILTAGLEAPASKTKASLKPDEWSATNCKLRPHPRHYQSSRLRGDVMSQFSSEDATPEKRFKRDVFGGVNTPFKSELESFKVNKQLRSGAVSAFFSFSGINVRKWRNRRTLKGNIKGKET